MQTQICLRGILFQRTASTPARLFRTGSLHKTAANRNLLCATDMGAPDELAVAEVAPLVKGGGWSYLDVRFATQSILCVGIHVISCTMYACT